MSSPVSDRPRESRAGASVLEPARHSGGSKPLSWSQAHQFAQLLLVLQKAGLSLRESMDALARKTGDPGEQQTLARVSERLREGASLSRALDEQGQAFPSMLIAVVKSSERTADLVGALERYVAYSATVESLRRRISSALIYPTILVVASLAITLFLLAYVLPRFSAVYASRGAEVPWASAVLLGVGQVLGAHQWAILVGLGAASLCVVGMLKSRTMRGRLVARLATLPVIGPAMRQLNLSRWYRTIGMLLDGGVPLLKSLQLSEATMSAASPLALPVLQRELREGRQLSDALQRCGLADDLAARMLRIAERSGATARMMDHIAEFYEHDVGHRIDRIVKLVEPVVMICVGFAVGLILILMYLPIFDLTEQIK